MQLWTIHEPATGKVLAASFSTSSAGSHPKDSGWAWDAATQRASRIERAPDLACERWDGAKWVNDLPALRAARWAEVKRARDAAQAGGCVTPLGRVDTDPASQLKIAGSVQMAMIAQAAGEPFAIDWTMQDNSTVAHDAPAMIAMGVAVGRHIADCHEAALAKRGAIEAAGDAAQIALVDPDQGWPA